MMRCLSRSCAAFLLAAGIVLPPEASRAADNPVTVRHMRSDYQVERDGHAVQTGELEIAANNEAAARTIAQQAFAYTTGIDHVELVEAYTVKADGRRLPVRLDAVREQLVPGVPNMPMYSDRKQRVVVFPDVGAGDAVAYKWRRVVDEPLFPGFFSAVTMFGRSAEWRDAEVSVTLPPGMEPATEAHGVQADPPTTAADGSRTWRWHHRADAVADDNSALSQLDRAPRVFVSTYPDWAAFGRAWGEEASKAAAVTPEIQALADEVTAGTDDKREQARRLYEWVSLRVRWVAIYLGQGGHLPHKAGDVLAARYGDCKDQVTLLTALLHAKGIAAEPVLISLDNTYALPAPPVLAAFNHVITYLPEWDAYADTTAGGAPFGTVPMPEYGKAVLHAGREGAAVRRVPPLPPGLAVSTVRTQARLDADGRIAGTTRVEATGPYATMLRGAARGSQMQGSVGYTAQRLRAAGQEGTGRVSPDDLQRVGAEYRIDARFRLEAQPGLAEGDPFIPPPGPALLPGIGEGLLAPVDSYLPASRPAPCYAGVQEEDVSLALPPGLRPVRLPRPRRIEEADFTYESRWTQDGDTIRAHRRLESRLTATLCTGAQREAAARALTVIRRDRQARLLLEDTDASKAE